MEHQLVSFSLQPGPAVFTFDECNHVLALSITAAGSPKMRDFDFIDLLIVRSFDEASLSHVIMKDYTAFKSNASAAQDVIPRYREILARQRAANLVDTGHSTGPRTLTILLEVIWANPSRIMLVPRTDERRRESPYHSFAVIYKRRLAIKPRELAFYMQLETSIPLILFPRVFDYNSVIMEEASFLGLSEPPRSNIPPTLIAMNVLLGERKQPNHFHSLPSNVLRAIALLVIDLEHPKRYWRRQLLDLGLICKSWSLVPDLFFEVHCEPQTENKMWPLRYGRGPGECRSSLRTLALALMNGRPERALSMRKFNLSNYYERLTVVTTPSILIATKIVLQFAYNLKEIDLPLDFLHDRNIIGTLRSMRLLKIATFGVYSHAETLSEADNHVTDVPILQAIHGCTSLDVLAATGSRSLVPDGQNKYSVITTEDIQLSCSLNRLVLTLWSLTGRTFSNLFNVPNPRMEYLDLLRISGLTNFDLYKALETMANSLIDVRIIDCEIQKGEEEEHAIDAIIPRLSSLTQLSVSSKHLSHRSIERKTWQADKLPTCLMIYHLTEAASFLKDFPKALVRFPSAWESISLFSSGYPSHEDMAAIGQTQMAGRAIGLIIFHADGIDPYAVF